MTRRWRASPKQSNGAGRLPKARDHIVIPALRIDIFLLHECDPTETALQSNEKIGVWQIAFQSHAFLAIAVEEKHGRGPNGIKAVEPGWMFLDMDFDGKEILVNEVSGLLLRVRLGVQPSTGPSRWRRTEVETLGPVVVLWGFRANSLQEHIEPRAARIAGVLLFVLAAFVVAAAGMALLGYSEPKPAALGIAVLVAAATIMPWLAKEKRCLSAFTGSAALRADAAESALCAYLSVIALAGLAVNAIWRTAWADPVAALAIVPLIIWEGRETVRGKPCGCC